MATKEDKELFYKLIKAGAKQAVRQGAAKAELPDELSTLLADQLAFTSDLIKKGKKLTPGYLLVLLIQNNLSLAKVATGKRFDCAISVLLLSISLTKAIALTAFTGPAHFAVTAAELLSECYSMDKTCGISEAAYKEVEKVTLPAYIWLEQGIIEWISKSLYPTSFGGR
ncbi:hypothetical protein [Azotobacter chroococcum]|uniref:hypothetical protein n=1 Tax=Azotobacter chroococcum TaxID=353 RepID=UPI0010ADF918|nr:hypothetical protein [Azotobacter chroococcum]TKD46939.1 hypothetical protein FCG41_01040 [Azotobacter chroococcum]